MNKPLKFLILASCLAAAGAAWSAGDATPLAVTNSASVEPSALADGEVKKVDKENGKLTLKHGELKNLGMPGMTMVFKVQDPAVLDKLQPGDKVRFSAEKAGGSIVVTQIELAK
jgi:Cu(I)/Ag(I) efflux system periplasmic protein CusF